MSAQAITLTDLHGASPELLAVARRVVAVNESRTAPRNLEFEFALIVEMAKSAIVKAEGK